MQKSSPSRRGSAVLQCSSSVNCVHTYTQESPAIAVKPRDAWHNIVSRFHFVYEWTELTLWSICQSVYLLHTRTCRSRRPTTVLSNLHKFIVVTRRDNFKKLSPSHSMPAAESFITVVSDYRGITVAPLPCSSLDETPRPICHAACKFHRRRNSRSACLSDPFRTVGRLLDG